MSWELISLETLQELAQQYGYGAVLLGILLESIGLPLPGEAIVLVGGFLAGQGDLNYGWVLACVIVGASVGNTLGYAVGRYGGWPLLLRIGQMFRMEEARLEDIKKRFAYNAPRAVFLGRFVTLLRIFAGPLAGIVGMPFRQFMFFNIAGALIWATVIVTLAFFAGQIFSLAEIMTWVGELGLVILGGVLAWLAIPPVLRMFRKPVLEQVGDSKAP
ncbi:DedA family protein [Synechococcales cyanobacterium C]|uniref:DedA family protein n=1 Tax=Petrachloros mirabilis ULC683 TaxID=2781853 RepID=A0A8K2AGZ1_9CYAN|nr:DedA family protein [Petrachloros mirabilis]NCJ05820.1 DedA family protein [Petrachloros mirabilis ULC683]